MTWMKPWLEDDLTKQANLLDMSRRKQDFTLT